MAASVVARRGGRRWSEAFLLLRMLLLGIVAPRRCGCLLGLVGKEGRACERDREFEGERQVEREAFFSCYP